MNKRYEIEKKVISYMESNDMIEPGERIVLGVSGGADSVCLFFLLLEYRKKHSFALHVVHVNHCIRPDASADAGYVEELCKENNIPFLLVQEDVRALAKQERCSQEDAGRRLRYRAFSEQAAALGGAKIAVAHNAEDRAETMLLHLFRGSGLRGLCGIEPVRGEIIRPILCLQREEIEAYLTERDIIWHTDSTNLEDTYTRNRVRHHILPYAEKEVSANCVKHMCQTADLLSETEQYMRNVTVKAMEKCVKEEGIEVAAFLELPMVLRKRVLLEIMEQMSPTGKDISLVHVEDVLRLFDENGNKTICLPFGIRFRRQYQFVIPEQTEQSPEGEEDSKDSLPEFEFQVFSYDSARKIPENQYTKWFDYDKIDVYAVGELPKLRYRETGDYLTLSDGKGGMIHKSLKAYMVTEKIPAMKRDCVPVLAKGKHVLWLVGYRISEYYKIGKDTKRVLEVKMLQQTEDKDG